MKKLILILGGSIFLFLVACGESVTPIIKTTQATPLVLMSSTEEADIHLLAIDGSSFYYYAEGDRVQLTPSLNWITVRFVNNDLVAQTAVLQDYGDFVDLQGQARQIMNPELTLLPLREGLTVQALVQGINSLRADSSDFLQVNPVFQTDDAEMAITDEFIATFPAGKSLEEITAINLSNGVEVVEPILGQENTFILRVLPTTMVDSLTMANLYQESGVAIHAAPNFVRIVEIR